MFQGTGKHGGAQVFPQPMLVYWPPIPAIKDKEQRQREEAAGQRAAKTSNEGQGGGRAGEKDLGVLCLWSCGGSYACIIGLVLGSHSTPFKKSPFDISGMREFL